MCIYRWRAAVTGQKTSGSEKGNLTCALTAAACRGCVLLSCFGKKVSKEPTWGGADR